MTIFDDGDEDSAGDNDGDEHGDESVAEDDEDNADGADLVYTKKKKSDTDNHNIAGCITSCQ